LVRTELSGVSAAPSSQRLPSFTRFLRRPPGTVDHFRWIGIAAVSSVGLHVTLPTSGSHRRFQTDFDPFDYSCTMAASPSCTLVARWRAMDRPTSRSTDGHRRTAAPATTRPPYSFTSPRHQALALPGKVRALSRFPLSNNGGDGSDGRGSQQQQKEQQERQRKAEADLQGAIDEVEGRRSPTLTTFPPALHKSNSRYTSRGAMP
jgi:hypothetical protein